MRSKKLPPVFALPAGTKLCKDCRWYWRGKAPRTKYLTAYCTHEKMRDYDLVSGEISFKIASVQRHANQTECGPSGKLWEKKTK